TTVLGVWQNGAPHEVPGTTGVHTPLAFRHETQSPSHAVAQQTPYSLLASCTQVPLEHQESPRQGSPSPRGGSHVPVSTSQNRSTSHCPSFVHAAQTGPPCPWSGGW